MTRASRKKILNQLLEASTNKWGIEEVEKMRSAFETASEAILTIERFELEIEEEPANLTAILHQLSRRKAKRIEED